jgi:PAS domain S-box-containing protein
MKSQKQKPPVPWSLILIFVILSLISVFVYLLYYNIEGRAILSEKQNELSAISDLKIRQITQWRQERIGDGEFLGSNTILVRRFSKFIRNSGNPELRIKLLQSLESLTKNYDYRNVLLLDTSGNVKLAFPGEDSVVGDHLKPLIPEIVRQRRVELSDLHQSSPINFVHIDLLVPLIDKSLNDSLVLGLLAIRVDPQKVLYPLIRSWPTPSKSSETLLVRKDGDEIVYLNELKFVENSALNLKKPATANNLPAAMAINGITATSDGIDYRNVHVVASMRQVPGTSWFMVSKIDREEVFSVLESQMRLLLIILILFILSTGLFFGVLWRNQRVMFYREKYEAERNHLALVKHFDYILKYANDIILLIDNDLKIIEANDRALETYMYSRDEFIGMKLEKIRAPETLSKLAENLKMVEENNSATFETFHKRKDNSIFPIEVSSRVVEIEGSKYFQTIGRDITERKSVEDTLKESEDKFRKIFEESPFSMLMTGKDFGIIKANQSFCNMIGYDEEELSSFTFRNFTHPDHISDDEVSLLRLIAGEIPVYHTQKRYVRKDGTIIWGSTTVSVLRNNKGEVHFFLAMIEDITLRRKNETDLISAKEKAEESDRLKTAFLHNVSHEIRTPMNAIVGFSTLLNETGLVETERRQYTDIISQSSGQLLSIINDIVDVANIESGQVKLNLKEHNLNSLLRSLNGQFSYKQQENNIPIILTEGLTDEKAEIITDGTKLIQIVSNLISNSLKFTRKGQIDFGYVLKDQSLEFFVRDTGIGISVDHIEKVFNRFYQVDSTGSRQYGGTGLGLSICKAYVELFGGTIGVESEPGKGTRFIFTIPYSPAVPEV